VRLVPPALASAAALVALGALAAGCGDDSPGGDTAKFCEEVQQHQAELLTAPTTLADVTSFVDLYKEIDKVAPLAIEPHWQALIVNYETASTVDPADPESVQKSLALAYATEGSAVQVRDFLLTNCNVDLGPVATIVPHGSAAPAGTVPATTAPG
jgi:hypothetical protein